MYPFLHPAYDNILYRHICSNTLIVTIYFIDIPTPTPWLWQSPTHSYILIVITSYPLLHPDCDNLLYIHTHSYTLIVTTYFTYIPTPIPWLWQPTLHTYPLLHPDYSMSFSCYRVADRNTSTLGSLILKPKVCLSFSLMERKSHGKIGKAVSEPSI